MTTQAIATFYAAVRPAGFSNANDFAVVFNSTGATPPVPNFSATVDGALTSAVAPLTVAFTDTSTGTPTAWLWNFGDDSTSTSQNPSHVYGIEGTYDVTLTVTNATGSSSIIQSGLVIVEGVRKTPPTFTPLGTAKVVTSFTADVSSGAHPLTVTFTDTSTGSPMSWVWDFADGGKATTQNPVHVFDHAGTFQVTLTATNAGGIQNASATITVS